MIRNVVKVAVFDLLFHRIGGLPLFVQATAAFGLYGGGCDSRNIFRNGATRLLLQRGVTGGGTDYPRRQRRPTKSTSISTTITNDDSTGSSTSMQEESAVKWDLPDDLPRRDDVIVALHAVRRACSITSQLQPVQSGSISTVSKADLSPVTVADFAVQGLILKLLNDTYPQDGFIAEEDSTALQKDDHLCQLVTAATELDPDIVLDAIDLGKSYQQWDKNEDDEHNRRPSRVWVLDPIDGTRGFLRGRTSGGQYAIALAMLDDQGIPVIGILGCPNLPMNVDDDNYTWYDHETLDNNHISRGCIFVATRGGGCYQLQLHPSNTTAVRSSSTSTTENCRRIRVTKESDRSTNEARFCIGVEKYSDALGQCIEMAKYIHGPDDRALDSQTGDIIRARRMDSQAKHGVIARGGAELYVRLPQPGYVEWIWDHAAGNVVIEEAGGMMSDVLGRPIDFSLGAQLSPDVQGVLMSAGGAFHASLVDAYAAVSKDK